MQVPAPRTVELPLSGLAVDPDSGLAAVAVEPVGDVGSCGLNERSGAGVRDVLLDDCGEVVDFSEEGDPAVICSVVVSDFLESEVSLWLSCYRQKLLDIIGLRIAHQLYNYWDNRRHRCFLK